MKALLTLGIAFCLSLAFGQDEPSVQTYNPGKLLKYKQHDLFFFSSTYTEIQNNWMGANNSTARRTFARQWLQITRGVSKSGRINLGLDVQLVNTHQATLSQNYSELFQAYRFENNNNARVGIGAIGLRARIQPFANEVNFTMQNSLTFPAVKHPEGFTSTDASQNLFWADWNRVTSWNQFFYTLDFDKSQLFLEGDLLFRLPVLNTQIPMLDIPVTVIYSKFFGNHTLYGLMQNMQRYVGYNQDANDFVIPAAFSQVGLGYKYNWSNGLQVEAAYNVFVRAVNSGKGESFNLGVRYLLDK